MQTALIALGVVAFFALLLSPLGKYALIVLVLAVLALMAWVVNAYLLPRFREERRDDRLPVQTGPATLAAKRTVDVSNQYGRGFILYVTFALPDGSRREFETKDRDHALFVEVGEGTPGTLTWQGTRFLGFARGPGPADTTT